MRDYRQLKGWKLSKHEVKTIIQRMNEPIVTQQATDRMIKILDSNYHKANLKLVVAG
jgi:hypothetical protein